jgi:hypothetical protein
MQENWKGWISCCRKELMCNFDQKRLKVKIFDQKSLKSEIFDAKRLKIQFLMQKS